MKILGIFFASVMTCVGSLPLILVLLTLQREAAVPPNPRLDESQVGEIQQLLIDHDPRQLLASDNQEIRLTVAELNTLLTYIKNSNPALDGYRVRAGLGQAAASVDFSVPFGALGMQAYFNFHLRFEHVGNALALDSVTLGNLGIPRRLLNPLADWIADQLAPDPNFQLVSAFTDSLHIEDISPERVVILLAWQEGGRQDLEDQAREVFVGTREAGRLQYYNDRLANLIDDLPAGTTVVTLDELLRPLFLLASINSTAGTSAVTENRAVFIVLTTYQTELELGQLIGSDVVLATPRPVKVVIGNREDLARHVVSSAAIAASAGAAMAEVLSVYKEVHDSRFRTGFSFTDIAANQVGAQLGTLASRSEADAMLFQAMMKDSLDTSDYMPELGTYDGMTEAEFTTAYGSRESDAYRERLQAITDSINERPFFREFAP